MSDKYSKIFKKHRRFWDYDEYLDYIEKTKENIEFIQDAYCRIFFYYAVIHIERRNRDKAKEYLLRGLELITNEPHLLCEMGMLYQHIDEDFHESIKYYMQALESDFCPISLKARGLRGIGYSLINWKNWIKQKNTLSLHSSLKIIKLLTMKSNILTT